MQRRLQLGDLAFVFCMLMVLRGGEKNEAGAGGEARRIFDRLCAGAVGYFWARCGGLGAPNWFGGVRISHC